MQAFYAKAQLRLHYFPIIAGATWFSTLTLLLLRWLSIGRPRYPGQANPYVPFISDIGAFQFKPVFVVGCTITSVCFVGTVFCVHHVRYSPNFYALVDDARWRRVLSGVAMVTGLAAGACLFLLSVFDTLEEHEKHRYLLVGTFGGLALSSLATEIVWWDETWKPARFPGLRKWFVAQFAAQFAGLRLTRANLSRCIVNNVLVILVTGVGIAFLVLLYTDYYRSAGLMEWIITYLGSFWLCTFAGYIRYATTPLSNQDILDAHENVRFREDANIAKVSSGEDADANAERQPLLPSHSAP